MGHGASSGKLGTAGKAQAPAAGGAGGRRGTLQLQSPEEAARLYERALASEMKATAMAEQFKWSLTENAQLRQRVDVLQAAADEARGALQRETAALKDENARLLKEVAELKEQQQQHQPSHLSTGRGDERGPRRGSLGAELSSTPSELINLYMPLVDVHPDAPSAASALAGDRSARDTHHLAAVPSSRAPADVPASHDGAPRVASAAGQRERRSSASSPSRRASDAGATEQRSPPRPPPPDATIHGSSPAAAAPGGPSERRSSNAGVAAPIDSLAATNGGAGGNSSNNNKGLEHGVSEDITQWLDNLLPGGFSAVTSGGGGGGGAVAQSPAAPAVSTAPDRLPTPASSAASDVRAASQSSKRKLSAADIRSPET